MLEVELHSLVRVADVQFAVSVVVPVFHVQNGNPAVYPRGADLVAHMFPVLLDYAPVVPDLLKQEQIQFFHQFFRQVVAQEGDVVFHLPNFKHLLAALAGLAAKAPPFLFGRVVPPLLDVLPNREPQVVRVDTGSRRQHHAGVHLGKFDGVRLVEI